MMQNLGLPEGVEAIDFRMAGPDDFELSRDVDGEFHIYRGVRMGGAGSSCRVKPLEGYEFVHTGFEVVSDLKAFAIVKGRPRFSVIKKIQQVSIKITAEFLATNQVAFDAIRNKYDELRQMAGFQGDKSSIVEVKKEPDEPAAVQAEVVPQANG